jgi:hypothetical protein
MTTPGSRMKKKRMWQRNGWLREQEGDKHQCWAHEMCVPDARVTALPSFYFKMIIVRHSAILPPSHKKVQL